MVVPHSDLVPYILHSMKQRENKRVTIRKSEFSSKSGIGKRRRKAKVEVTPRRPPAGRGPSPHYTTNASGPSTMIGQGVNAATVLFGAQARVYYPPPALRSGQTMDDIPAMQSLPRGVEPLQPTEGPVSCVTPVRHGPDLPPPGPRDSSEGMYETGGNGMVMAVKLISSSPSRMRNMTFEEAVPRANLSVLPLGPTYSSFRNNWLRRARGARTKVCRSLPHLVSPRAGAGGPRSRI